MKKKLFVSAMSLVMAVILMTSTSFAWFTINESAEATDVTVTLQSVENVEIALDDGSEPEEVSSNDGTDQYTWGGTVKFSEPDALTNLATNVGGVLQTVEYNDDGRTAGLKTATSAGLANSMKVYKYGGESVGVGFCFWVRSNTGTVNLDIDVEGVSYMLLVGGSESAGTGIATANGAGAQVELILYFEGDPDQGGYVAKDVVDGLGDDVEVTITATPGA